MTQNTFIMNVVDVCGPHCVGVEDGLALFERILPVLQKGGHVCLEFDGVLTITSSFLNASVGKLYGQFDKDDVEKRLIYKGLDEGDNQLLQLVIKNAQEHFAKPENARHNQDKIVRDILGEGEDG